MCKAYTGWRRHLTVTNGFALAIVGLLIMGFCMLLPMLIQLMDATPRTELRTSFGSRGQEFTAQVLFTNKGHRQILIDHVVVTVHDEQGEARSYIGDIRSWREAFTVEPGGIGSKLIYVGTGPGMIKDPITKAVVYHYDGSVEQLVDSSEVVLTVGQSVPVIAP